MLIKEKKEKLERCDLLLSILLCGERDNAIDELDIIHQLFGLLNELARPIVAKIAIKDIEINADI